MFIKNYNFNKIDIINFLISFFPLSLILGNLAININLTLICLLGIYIFKIKIFVISNKIYKYLFFSFFFYLIFITTLNNWSISSLDELYKLHLVKSFFFLRFLLLFFIITKLIENKFFDTKKFFLSCSFWALLISGDVFIQYIFGKNIFGFAVMPSGRATSFFGEELIAGGFLQKFSIFLIFLISIKIKNKNYLNLIIIFLFIIFLIPIIFTYNRMPLVIFLSSFLLFFLIERKFKEIFTILISSFLVVLVIINFSSSTKIKTDFQKFYYESKDIAFNIFPLFKNNEKVSKTFYETGYLIHFNSGIQIWKQNKFFGNGLKSFRLKCVFAENQICNTHPHNYLIEILVDSGIIGLFLIYLIFLLGLINFVKFYLNETNLNNRLTSVVFFLLIFFEFFPFRSTGSFFTTSNASFIFLILSIFLNIKKLNKL